MNIGQVQPIGLRIQLKMKPVSCATVMTLDHALRRAFNDAGGATISPYPEGIGAFDLKKFRLVEHCGDLGLWTGIAFALSSGRGRNSRITRPSGVCGSLPRAGHPAVEIDQKCWTQSGLGLACGSPTLAAAVLLTSR